ncbi:MAG: hypothetical protein ACHQWU_10230 [Gemmatimonadales bacterium]
MQPSYILRAVLALLLALGAAPLHAQSNDEPAATHGDSTARVTARRPLTRSTFHIVSVDGTEALLLTDTTIVAQLTDAGLARTSSGIDSGTASKDVPLAGRMIAGMFGGLLKPMFDHAIEYDLHDLAQASYSNGRLVLRSRDGSDVFGDTDFFGRQVMENFSAADAREFAARANRARASVAPRT